MISNQTGSALWKPEVEANVWFTGINGIRTAPSTISASFNVKLRKERFSIFSKLSVSGRKNLE